MAEHAEVVDHPVRLVPEVELFDLPNMPAGGSEQRVTTIVRRSVKKRLVEAVALHLDDESFRPFRRSRRGRANCARRRRLT